MLTIKLNLSQAGRKADLLAGGDGQQMKTLTVAREDASFAELLGLASMTPAGAALDLTVRNVPDFDAMPTPAEVLARELARKQAAVDAEAARLAAIQVETLAVLSERKTKTESSYHAGEQIVLVYAAWPWNHSARSVKESPAAVAWEAELAAQRDAAKVAAQVRANEKAAAAKIAAETKAAKLAAHRAARGLETADEDFGVEDGALTEAPVWESHSRGKNWLAILTANPAAPGGLKREFAAKAKGDSFYLVPDWTPGDAIEFGADYYSGSGRKSADRWYGFVVRIEADYVVIRKVAGGKTAIKEGEKFRKALKPDTRIADAIQRINGEGAIVPSAN